MKSKPTWTRVTIRHMKTGKHKCLLILTKIQQGPLPVPRPLKTAQPVPFPGSLRIKDLTRPVHTYIINGRIVQNHPSAQRTQMKQTSAVMQRARTIAIKNTINKIHAYANQVPCVDNSSTHACNIPDVFDDLTTTLSPLFEQREPQTPPVPQMFIFPPQPMLGDDPILPVVTPAYTGQRSISTDTIGGM